ncbi:MAG TPA: glycoside hydrolase family 3 N-terminal domain-containing protein, partial [Agriterribacter sp.]|nr:glycoside hydrolase family 3 N-terminal domain-containing protein [Agriterribacter sp.]
AAEGGRDYNTTDMSRVRMYNEYLSPYKAAIDAGVGSIMTSFNEIEAYPLQATAGCSLTCCVNNGVLKGWSFQIILRSMK